MNVQVWTMDKDAPGLKSKSWEGKRCDETDKKKACSCEETSAG